MTLSGHIFLNHLNLNKMVLIPLLVDDPLWEIEGDATKWNELVLIPLLVDDPLWVYYPKLDQYYVQLS